MRLSHPSRVTGEHDGTRLLKDEILAAPDILAEVAMLRAWRKSLSRRREKKQQDAAAIPEGSGLPARSGRKGEVIARRFTHYPLIPL
jgi:hypothetical protein